MYNLKFVNHNKIGDRVKKTIFVIITIILTYVVIGNAFSKKIVIPNEAIRIRVLANSNSDYDQYIKKEVKGTLMADIADTIDPNDSIATFRSKIVNNMDLFKRDIQKTLLYNNYELPFDINYGLNYFPQKQFKGIKYDEGYYESLVVTLGDGLGDNWWCVLFPPLCLIEAEEHTDIEYTTIVSELINKYF